MDKLKTLKEITEFTIGGDITNESFDWSVTPAPFDYDGSGKQTSKMVSIDDLKQEAIEWIRLLQNPVVIDWIKHFFNIKDEDLE